MPWDVHQKHQRNPVASGAHSFGGLPRLGPVLIVLSLSPLPPASPVLSQVFPPHAGSLLVSSIPPECCPLCRRSVFFLLLGFGRILLPLVLWLKYDIEEPKLRCHIEASSSCARWERCEDESTGLCSEGLGNPIQVQ